MVTTGVHNFSVINYQKLTSKLPYVTNFITSVYNMISYAKNAAKYRKKKTRAIQS